MRTFIAFTLPDDVANQIIDWQQQNMPEGVFPEPVTNLHMTLAFLGDTPDELVPQINQILAGLDISQVQISGPRTYTEQAKLAFLEFDEVGGSAVWEQINSQLNALMGYSPQFRPWLPHTTVWRFAPDHKPNINPPLPSLTFSPTAVTLYQSVKNPNGGATYQHVSRHANILDPIESELDQTVYQDETPRKTVQDFIKRIYYRALDKELGVDGEQWADLYMTGSLTTFQYSKTSDCDVSVFPNYDLLYKELGLDPDSARKKLIHLSIEHIDGTFLPGTTHPLQFFVVPHGILPGDLYKPGLRSAFDLHDSLWFQKPEKDRVHDIALEYPDLFKRAQDIGEKLTQMLDAGDDDAARELWHQIHKKRQLDQQAGLGDFCEGNIVYKYLLNEGLFDRIRSELGEYIAKVEWVGSDIDEGHADDRFPWIYVPETDRLVIGSPGSSHRQMFKYTPEADQGTEWYGAYGSRSNRVAIFSQYDNDYFRPEDLDPKMIANLREAWPGATIIYPDIDGDRQEYTGAVKWSMPPANEWENFALDIEDRQQDGQYGEVSFAEDTGVRWQYNKSTLANVAHLLKTPLMFSVSRGHYQGFGHLSYRVLSTTSGHPMFSFIIELNQMLTPEAASYCLWHEIQHAFQLVEGRADPGFSSPPILQGEAWEKYINDPHEIDADEMAAQMHKIMELPVIDEVPVTEGSEKEYYEELIGEGWPQDEALDMLVKPEEEISLEYVLKSRMAKWKKADLWEDRVTQKVIYDFDKDTIMLGTQATQAEHPDSKIIGEYADGAVTLFGVEKQWISPQYFHRLWAFSYPDKELKDVYYKREEGKVKLRTVRRPKRSAYVFPGDADFGEGLKRDKNYAMIWGEDQQAINVTFKGMYMAFGEPLYATFWRDNDYRKPLRVLYDHFVWMMQNHMITPVDRHDTPNFLPWSEEEQDFYRNSGYDIPKSVYEMAIYKHICPMCRGYLTDRGGVYTCSSCPFEWDSNINDFGGRQSGWKKAMAPKFYNGDSVIMKAYGESGTIQGEPHWSEEDQTYWYYVNTYDKEGPVGLVQFPEDDMERPTRYDEPGEMTLKDMFGITPEGEDYFRNANEVD